MEMRCVTWLLITLLHDALRQGWTAQTVRCAEPLVIVAAVNTAFLR